MPPFSLHMSPPKIDLADRPKQRGLWGKRKRAVDNGESKHVSFIARRAVGLLGSKLSCAMRGVYLSGHYLSTVESGTEECQGSDGGQPGEFAATHKQLGSSCTSVPHTTNGLRTLAGILKTPPRAKNPEPTPSWYIRPARGAVRLFVGINRVRRRMPGRQTELPAACRRLSVTHLLRGSGCLDRYENNGLLLYTS